MYAIVEDSGAQLRVREGDVLLIDPRPLEAGAEQVVFDKVLLVADADKGERAVGRPYVQGASVSAAILEREVKGEKIDVVKFKRRKGYRRKQGHRQKHMRVRVESINA
ncbi:MAG: 50S ribosomal protein L21 [Planctomycetota bacterium]|nr:MAG: 50S ribosomal protein L21 [Planctomycetota bacterium]